MSAHSIVYESRDPANGQWEPVSDFGFGDVGNKTVFEMAAMGEHLYVGTLNLDGYQVWRTDGMGVRPYSWEQIIERGAYRGPHNQCALSMYPFRGALYIGSGIQGGGIDRQNSVGPAGPELIRLFPDGHWDLIVGEERNTCDGIKSPLSGYLPGFDNFFSGYFWRMCDHEGWLYLSSFDWSFATGYTSRERWPQAFENIIDGVGTQRILESQAGFDLYRSFDGENWLPVSTNGLENPYNIGLRTMVSCPAGFFLGTANPFGPKVIPLDGERYVPNPRGGCEVWFAPTKPRGGQ